MCGISGWAGPQDDALAARMRGTIHHRGPDEQGRYSDGQVTLLHERLSIIDLAGGHQPMTNEDGRLRLIFNGEIYNYRELKKELEAKGHRFNSDCDTEVIVHLYEECGQDTPTRLLGMFAFAIWDSRERTLFLARDRIGIKPLFYSESGGRFLFASELKALIAAGVPREMDPEAVDQFLTFMYVPAPATILKSARKLPPGHTLTWRNGDISIRQYWSLPSAEAARPAQSFEEATESLRELLGEAVRCRLMSDVPLGAYLSGGLDSSVVVALMAQSSERPVNTFSVGFTERGFDETPFSRIVAERFGTNHRELTVRHRSADELPKIIRALDEPVADSAAIPTYLMAQATKPHVTVVLTGEGADELFAGYSHYKILLMGDRLAAVGPGGAAGILRLLSKKTEAVRAAEYLRALRDRAGAYLALKSVFTTGEKTNLYEPSFFQECRRGESPRELVARYLKPDDGPYLHQLLRLDLATWLADDLLVKVDRMTMAHAVEARVPFLDHRVVEAVMRMPPRWKLRMFEGKSILRAAATPLLPKEIVRRKKTGFAVPVAEWAAGELRDMFRDLLSEQSLKRRGLFQPEAVEELLSRPKYGMFERRKLWTLLTLELWCREFL